MRIRLTISEVEGCFEFDIPNDHDYVKYANKRVEDGKTVGWDAVACFAGGIRECVSEDINVEVIPEDGKTLRGIKLEEVK